MKILCRLGFHAWIYPEKSADGNITFKRGSHRYCEDCRMEEHKVMCGGWVFDTSGQGYYDNVNKKDVFVRGEDLDITC